MTIVSLIAFAGAIFVLAITPGPGVFATIARAMVSGFKPAVFVAIGIVIGDLVFLLLAIYGLTALAIHLQSVFLVIKYVGSVYLIYLGLTLWMQTPEKSESPSTTEQSWLKNFLSGLFITLGNPKVIFFYVSFLPTFVELNLLTNADVFMIASVLVGILGTVLLMYGYIASKSISLFKSPKSQTVMNRAAGSTMMATGAFLASKT